jgi:alpha-galactosidase
MTIEWRADERQLHLRNDRIGYVMRVLEDGSLGHLHLGRPLELGRSYRHLGPARFEGFANRVGDPVGLEVPTAGSGDFRPPALAIEAVDGSTIVRLVYVDHAIDPGKPALAGLPSTYVEDESEAETLTVHLIEEALGLHVHVLTTIYADRAAIVRSIRLSNEGDAPIRLTTVMSASLHLPDAGWDLVTLSGAWARERHVVRRRLVPGDTAVASRRGASGLEHNPSLLLVRPDTTEAGGEAIGLSLVYSGNFLGQAHVEPSGTARVRIGIEPETFAWHLAPGDVFQAPEAVIAWSDEGIGALSDTFHRLYRERLARGPWRDRPRPILLNSWEATYTDFDEAKLVDIAASAAELGVELFVLDDGWFGERDDDTSSLGDWSADRRKLPSGLPALAARIGELGMSFGLWIEPEMVNERSRLFKEHPDWAIGVPGRSRTPSRNQLVLDLSRPEVVDHLASVLTELLGSAPIAYVKWDMNRPITEPWSAALPPDRQGEFHHRYILGVYELYRRLTRAFPEILFESCASGGGRFDPGMLAWAPQGWTSDDTDPIERLAIGWGTSLIYPLSAMGAHVSAVPNHQVGRVTPLATRAAVAFFGVFGYELDPRQLSAEERATVADQIAFYRRWRDLFQFGRFLRLVGPFDGDGNETAWMVASEDGRTAIVAHYRVLRHPGAGRRRQRLRGLDPATVYAIAEWPVDESATDGPSLRGGDELMAVGLLVDGPSGVAELGDFRARLFVLRAVDESRS